MVTNSGKISAPGGQMLLTARAAAGVQDAVINNTGMVEATSVRSVNGEIILEADDGTVTSSGTLDASGTGAGETGGVVKVLGKDIAVADGARIDVSGDAGGGTALIGGNFHGAGSEVHAQTTTVGKAVIKADAITSGNGGNVAVWSDGETSFAGSISARGGAQSGNGGQVETSGHDLFLDPGAAVVTVAPQGKSGYWLLDPANIDINVNGFDSANGETFANNNTGSASIAPTTIDTALLNGNVTLQASTDITVSSQLTINSATNNTLTLEAGRSVIVNQSITYATGNVAIIAASLNPSLDTANRGVFPAFISAASTASISAAQLSLTLSSNGLDGSLIGSNAAPLTVLGNTPTFISTIGANAFLTTGAGSGSNFRIGNNAAGNGASVGNGTLTIIAQYRDPEPADCCQQPYHHAAGGLHQRQFGVSARRRQCHRYRQRGGRQHFPADTANLMLTNAHGAVDRRWPTRWQYIHPGHTHPVGRDPGQQGISFSTVLRVPCRRPILNTGPGTTTAATSLSLTSDTGTIGTHASPLPISCPAPGCCHHQCRTSASPPCRTIPMPVSLVPPTRLLLRRVAWSRLRVLFPQVGKHWASMRAAAACRFSATFRWPFSPAPIMAFQTASSQTTWLSRAPRSPSAAHRSALFPPPRPA